MNRNGINNKFKPFTIIYAIYIYSISTLISFNRQLLMFLFFLFVKFYKEQCTQFPRTAEVFILSFIFLILCSVHISYKLLQFSMHIIIFIVNNFYLFMYFVVLFDQLKSKICFLLFINFIFFPPIITTNIIIIIFSN